LLSVTSDRRTLLDVSDACMTVTEMFRDFAKKPAFSEFTWPQVTCLLNAHTGWFLPNTVAETMDCCI